MHQERTCPSKEGVRVAGVTRRGILLRAIALACAFALPVAGPLHAQETAARAGPKIGVGLGLARAGFSLGDESNGAVGPVVNGFIALRRGERTTVMVEADLQPYSVDSPLRFEAYSSLYLWVSLEWRILEGFFVRPAVGIQNRSWSGEHPVTSSDSGGALGLSVGTEVEMTPRLRLAPELFARSAIIELEGSVAASLVGVRVVARWHPS